MKALVNAANIIVMAKSTTHMAVEDGGREDSCAIRGLTCAGARSLQPPLPECPSSDGRSGSIFGGSCTVVAITANFPSDASPRSAVPCGTRALALSSPGTYVPGFPVLPLRGGALLLITMLLITIELLLVVLRLNLLR